MGQTQHNLPKSGSLRKQLRVKSMTYAQWFRYYKWRIASWICTNAGHRMGPKTGTFEKCKRCGAERYTWTLDMSSGQVAQWVEDNHV